jgi:hypothetical protein
MPDVLLSVAVRRDSSGVTVDENDHEADDGAGPDCRDHLPDLGAEAPALRDSGHRVAEPAVAESWSHRVPGRLLRRSIFERRSHQQGAVGVPSVTRRVRSLCVSIEWLGKRTIPRVHATIKEQAVCGQRTRRRATIAPAKRRSNRSSCG